MGVKVSGEETRAPCPPRRTASWGQKTEAFTGLVTALRLTASRQPPFSGSQSTDSPPSLGHSLQTAPLLWVAAYRQPSLSGSKPTDSPPSPAHSLPTALTLWVTAYRQPSLSGSQPTDSPPAYSLQTALVTTCLLWLLERETSLSICFCTTHTSAAKAGVLMHCYQ